MAEADWPILVAPKAELQGSLEDIVNSVPTCSTKGKADIVNIYDTDINNRD